jgi:hypothetical protein
MRHTSLITFVLLAFLNYAQEPIKPVFESVFYQNDGKIYANKALPIYLSISSSPDGSNPVVLDTPDNLSDGSPMYFDTNGLNYIRSKWAVDPETKKLASPKREVLFPVNVDGIAPVSGITFTGAPSYRSQGINYYGKGLSYSLSSTDPISGVQSTFKSHNSDYVSYESPLDVSTEGDNTIYYFSVDNVGNTEDTKISSFVLDLTPPVSNYTLSDVYGDNILGPTFNIGLESTDNLSGVKGTYYTIDDMSQRVYGSPIDLSGLSDGPHTLRFYSDDNVENEESIKELMFYLDKINPETQLVVIGDQHNATYYYVSTRTTFELPATDNKAGVAKTSFSINKQDAQTYTAAFSLPNELGLHSVTYNSEDNVRNVEEKETRTFYMDNKSPNTSIDYGMPQFFTRDTLFINQTTPITIIPRDKHSGVQATTTTVNGEVQAGNEFTIPTEGHKEIVFSSVDMVNNQEEDKTSRAYVDNTPPEIFINFSLDNIGTENNLPVYPNYVRMFVGATDEKTGTKSIKYSIDGGKMTEYSSPRTLDISERDTFTESKVYEVEVIAEDMLGNTSTKTHKFIVKN